MPIAVVKRDLNFPDLISAALMRADSVIIRFKNGDVGLAPDLHGLIAYFDAHLSVLPTLWTCFLLFIFWPILARLMEVDLRCDTFFVPIHYGELPIICVGDQHLFRMQFSFRAKIGLCALKVN